MANIFYHLVFFALWHIIFICFFLHSFQSCLLPTAHRRSCLHWGGLCGQCSTDWLLCPHWKELRHSEWDEHAHTHTAQQQRKETMLNNTKLCPQVRESGDKQRHCLLSPVVKRSHGSHVQMNWAANCQQPLQCTKTDLWRNVKFSMLSAFFCNSLQLSHNRSRMCKMNEL